MILTGLGRLGRDVEVRYAQDGTAVANLALAYNYGKKDADGRRPTTWVDASLWGERAEKLAQYLTKGQQLCVVLDDVYIHTYKRNDNTMGTSLRARVVSIEFAGGPKREGDSTPAAKSEPGSWSRPAEPTAKAGGKFDDFDGDVPF